MRSPVRVARAARSVLNSLEREAFEPPPASLISSAVALGRRRPPMRSTAFDGGRRERRGIVVGARAEPQSAGGDAVDTIGVGLPSLGSMKVLHLDFHRLPGR